ncbi:MAG: hypothetical protein AMXMBFR53_27190 [Gemmatimonadota bacterium]
MGFFLKRLLGELVMPTTACLVLAALGGLLLWRGRRRLGGSALAAAFGLLWLASLSPVSEALMRAVETKEPRFPGDSVAYVLVLGGGHRSDPRLPVTAQISSPSLHRLAEGVVIANAQPWSTLLLSAWGGADPKSNADMYREVASALGFPEGRMVLDPRPRDTRQEAEMWAPYLRGHRFALVTSAFHMDRALALFRAQGLDPIPAPTGHLAADSRGFDVFVLFPDEGSLLLTRLAWRELVGRVWARLIGAT